MKIDWKRKLTSRKFWMAIITFVTALLLAVGMGESDVAKVTGVITAGATAIAYIIGEGLIDAKSKNDTEVEEGDNDEDF